MDTNARKRTDVVEATSIRRLKSKAPAIDVIQGPTVEGQWAGKRLLTLDGKAAFEMSFWCGTCPLVFQRLEGAGRTLSVEALTAQLNTGVEGCDSKIIKALAGVVPTGDYQPLLLEFHPRLVYFTEEQVSGTRPISPACFHELPWQSPCRALDESYH